MRYHDRMVEISVKYTGNFHCDATHGPSHSSLSTDAPTDNRGKGESFSPTDLVATALATCMSTTMAFAADDHKLDLSGLTVRVEKHMSKDAPRRIAALPSELHIPLPANCPQRPLLEAAALNCPVHKSLPPEIERPTTFFWEG
jgi:putative redox protein